MWDPIKTVDGAREAARHAIALALLDAATLPTLHTGSVCRLVTAQLSHLEKHDILRHRFVTSLITAAALTGFL